METMRVSSDGGLDEEDGYAYTVEHYSATRKDKLLPFVTWILLILCYVKWSDV